MIPRRHGGSDKKINGRKLILLIIMNNCFIKSLKIKGQMRQITNRLLKAQTYEKQTSKKLSEIDTQVILIEPLLCLASYNVNNPFIIKRSSRNPSSNEFDIEVYVNSKLKIAVEVKSLSSNEFNINDSYAGCLFEYCSTTKYENNGKHPKPKDVKWEKTGATAFCEIKDKCSCYEATPDGCRRAVKKLTNYPGDAVGQLRAYCVNFNHFCEGQTIAVLTNGLEWVIFDHNFIENPCSPISSNQIITQAKITDREFYKKIIRKLK